jgi:hypothetical protein
MQAEATATWTPLICGDCKLRGAGRQGRQRLLRDGRGSAPNQVWTRRCRSLQTLGDVARLSTRSWRAARCASCAYGDPGALPFDVWRAVLATASGFVGYTHTWRRLRSAAETRSCMASVDTRTEFLGCASRRAGARSGSGCSGTGVDRQFRSDRCSSSSVQPATRSDHRTTCERCQLCRGTSSPARSVDHRRTASRRACAPSVSRSRCSFDAPAARSAHDR